MSQQFEFHIYKGRSEEGVHASEPEVVFESLSGDSAARSKAGRLAKKFDGPVDLAYAGAADWSDRYITTASPSTFYSSGYRFERLEA